jgi:hypothetical protein
MLIRKLTGHAPLPQVTFSTPPKISGTGTISFDKTSQPKIQLMGEAEITNFTYLGTRFKRLTTEIALQGKHVFLTNLQASHAHGNIHGRALIKDDIIRYKVESSLPSEAFIPFIKSPIAHREFAKASFSNNSLIHIRSEGIIHRNKKNDWLITGHCKLQNFSYKGVAMKLAKAYFQSSPKGLTFSDIRLIFNHQHYTLRQKYGGPSSGQVDADKVVIDTEKRMVHITNVQASAWPAPVVRLFHTKAANHCEQYRFFRPPTLTANGSFDLNRSQARTDFTINVRAPGTTHYHFLGEDLTLKRLRGIVRIRQGRVDVSDLSFYTFQGPCQGDISVWTKKSSYEGSLQWSRLHLKDLGKTYGFKQADKGLITGRIDYKGKSKDISQFNGKGGIGLERGNLFSIPMLGPLSPLISSVLGEKNPTNEHAENASCTFVIRRGVVYSDNFLANTRSLRFTGEGNINLNNQKIDLLVRMNARGLFSIFALPLKPFMGLFQFKGTGHYSKPKWKTSIFTTPKRGKKDPIFRRPPKARVINE